MKKQKLEILKKHRLRNCVLLLFFGASVAKSSVTSIDLLSDINLPSPRWMFESGKEVSVRRSQLEKLKRAQLQGDFRNCYFLANGLIHKYPSIGSWISNIELQCASAAFAAKQVKAESVYKTISRIERNSSWLLYSPARNFLKATMVNAHFVLLKKYLKSNRIRSWVLIDKLKAMSSWMGKTELAELYKTAGELAFIQQKMQAAKNYVLRSLSEEDSPALRNKLASIEKAISRGSESNNSSSGVKEIEENSDSESTEREIELVKRMEIALLSGDLLSAAEDGVKIMREFPGGRRADWAASRVLQVYQKAEASAPKSKAYIPKYFSQFLSLKGKIARRMNKVDGLRILEWARVLYRKTDYSGALQLAEEASDRLKETVKARKALYVAGMSALYTGDYGKAREFLGLLEKKFSGTEEAIEAVLRLGLIFYRLKDYPKAVAYFEKILVLPSASDWQVTARYWLWRCLQKQNKDKAEEQRKILHTRFPLTYYGLRARAEGNNNIIQRPETSPNPSKSKIWLTDSEKKSWNRVKLLLSVGWLQEAEAELKQLPPPADNVQREALARVWAAAFNYPKAIRMAYKSVDSEKQFDSLSFLKLIFPIEFTSEIDKFSKQRGLNANLVKGIIRQESAYSIKAKSSASAFGLMQIIPSTAREIAQELGRSGFVIPDDLFVPETSINFGTYYFSKMLKKFNGNVPISLAAYNAGPGRMSKWMKSRSELELKKLFTSIPESEIWIDELPWKETNLYIKAILRNYMVYKALADGRVKVEDPIWK